MGRLLGTAIVAVVGATLGAGCAGSELGTITVEATPEYLAEAAERTSEAQTGRFRTTIHQDVDAPGLAFEQRIELDGSYDAEAGLVDATMHTAIDAPGADAEGDADVVQVGTELYYRGFPFTELPYRAEDDEWVRLEVPDELVELQGLGSAGAGPVTSPSQQLDLLIDLGGEVEEVGVEEVDGTTTTRLHTTYDLPDEALDALDELAPGIDPPEDISLDVWIDGDGFVRRVESTNELAGTVTEISSEFGDFGIEVDVEAPEGATDVEALVEPLVGAAEDAQTMEELADELEDQLADDEDDDGGD